MQSQAFMKHSEAEVSHGLICTICFCFCFLMVVVCLCHSAILIIFQLQPQALCKKPVQPVSSSLSSVLAVQPNRPTWAVIHNHQSRSTGAKVGFKDFFFTPNYKSRFSSMQIISVLLVLVFEMICLWHSCHRHNTKGVEWGFICGTYIKTFNINEQRQ